MANDHAVDAIHAALDALDARPRLGTPPSSSKSTASDEVAFMEREAAFYMADLEQTVDFWVGIAPHPPALLSYAR